MSSRVAAAPGPSAHETLTARGAVLMASTPSDRADLLDETDWSRKLAWRPLEAMAAYLRLYQLPAGRALFREGDHDAFMAIVLEGALEIRKSDSADQDRIVTLIGRGKMLGQMSLLDGAARSASATAAAATTLLILTRQEFHRIGEEDPALGLAVTTAIAATIAQLLRQTTGALVEHLES